MVNGWKNCHMYFGHIELPLVGPQAVITLETEFPMLRTSLFTPNSNDNLLEKSLDLVEERRENDMVQLACYQ